MRALAIGLIVWGILGIAVVGFCADVAEGFHETQEASVDVLLQQGPALIAAGDYKRVLTFIGDVPEQARNDIQVRTLECFANFKGWVSAKNPVCKTDWWKLRQKLIYIGDSEATPLLVIFLKDEDPYVRKYAAELLGYIGDERALDDLRAAKENDNNSGVRKYAKWAYNQVSGGLTPVVSGLPPLVAPRIQIPVTMEAAGPITQSRRISFVNSTREFKIIFLTTIDYKRYYADFESWGNIIIAQLEVELQKRGVIIMTADGNAGSRVVIGVLDWETRTTTKTPQGQKKALMAKLEQKPLVRLVDIPEHSTLSDLKKNEHEKAEGYKSNYQVDMILHVSRHFSQTASIYNFSLIDLYTKKAHKVSIKTEGGLIDELTAEQLSNEVLVNPCLNHVMRSKQKTSATQAVQATPKSDYTFNVTVQDVKLVQGAWATRCIVNVLVERADSQWSHTYEGNNASPASAERAIDGAVYRVVEAVIADPDFRNAISQ